MSEPEQPDVLAELAKAMEMAKKVSAKIDRLLEPLEREMRIMKWPAEYQSIMWEAVMLEAKSRWEGCCAPDGPPQSPVKE